MKRLLALALGILAAFGATVNAQTRIQSYNATQQSDNIQLSITFSSSVLVTSTTPCFINKLVFLRTSSSNTSTPFYPRYPGTCQASTTPVMTVRASVDPRDYANLVQDEFFFRSRDSTFLAIVPGMEVGLLPSFNVLPLLENNALQVMTFTSHVDLPGLLSFDIDLERSLVLLHFTDLIDVTTFEPTRLTLRSPTLGSSVTLTQSSRPRANINFVKTVCVALSSGDKRELMTQGVCMDKFDCSCSYMDLGMSYVGIAVPTILAAMSRPVSRLRPLMSSTRYSDMAMELTVEYIGCDAITFPLEPDEVYQVRPGEYITRIDCPSSTVGGQRINESSVLTRDEGSYLSFPYGLQDFSLYTCSSRGDVLAQHYITNEALFVGLPMGRSYSTRLLSPLGISFFFASDPPVNIYNQNFEILFSQATSGTAPPDPGIRTLSPYRVELIYLQTPASVQGMFSLTIRNMGRALITMPDITVAVTPPSVSIYPPVAALLPNDINITLQCTTNSPSLMVFWTNDSLASDSPIRSSVPSFTVQVPVPDGAVYYCGVRNPEDVSVSPDNRVALTSTVFVNIPEPLSVYRDSSFIMDRSQIPIINRFSGSLTLRCIGHASSGVNDLIWISEPRGRSPVVLTPETNNNFTSVSYRSNEANLTVNNFIEPYRGILRCQSPSSNRQATFFVLESEESPEGCPGDDVDSTWGITWNSTILGARDSQPCPIPEVADEEEEGEASIGFAFRMCGADGQWEEEVDVSSCVSQDFQRFSSSLPNRLAAIDISTGTRREMLLTFLIGELSNLTRVRTGGLFPQELDIALRAIEDIIFIENEEDVIDVFDNLLDVSNTFSWTLLNRFADGGRQLLYLIDRFGRLYVQGQLSVVPGTSATETTLARGNIWISGQSFPGRENYSDVVLPNQTLSVSQTGRAMIPAEFLDNNRIAMVVSAAVENLQNILPLPEQQQSFNSSNSTKVVIGASIVLSLQALRPPNETMPLNFTQDIELAFTTNLLPRVSDPRCAAWNPDVDGGSWDEMGVDTVEVSKGDVGEFKTFRVQGRTQRMSAFVVLADQETEFQEFELTIPFYIGCGFVLFGAVLSIFSFLLSCMCDRLRKYSISAYLVHMSLCCSLICGFTALLAGIKEALSNEIGCIATSAIIHYFFTAAFSWMLCETLATVFFPWVSKKPASFILFFILGWGLPVIPTAVSLGLIRNQYTTTTQCWFFFDGEFVVDIVMAFIIPKLALLVLALVIFILSCGTICYMNNRAKGMPKIHVKLLCFEWLGLLLLLMLIPASWAFGMLHVNNGFGVLDATISGWVFMGLCIALGLLILFFSSTITVTNLKVDYEVLWDASDGLQAIDRKKAKHTLNTHLPMTDMLKKPLSIPAGSGAGGNAYAAANEKVFGDSFEKDES